MPLNSVNTNVGAMSAVRQFAAARAEQDVVQRRVATGLRVASVRDNSAVWTIAQKQRGDARAVGVLVGGLQRAQSILDVALASGEVVAGLLVQMKEKALAAADASLDLKHRQALSQDFEKLRDQVDRTVKNADFDGVNLIDADAADSKVAAGLATETVLVPRIQPAGPRAGQITGWRETQVPSTLDLNAERLSLGGGNVTVTGAETLTDANASRLLVGKLDVSLRNTGAALARLGSAYRQVQRQQVFLLKLQDGLNKGAGELVDADLGRESARLRALQVKEQLGIQATSIANSAPGVLLQLFRPSSS